MELGTLLAYFGWYFYRAVLKLQNQDPGFLLSKAAWEDSLALGGNP